jgi:hypothetical protein
VAVDRDGSATWERRPSNAVNLRPTQLRVGRFLVVSTVTTVQRGAQGLCAKEVWERRKAMT